MSEIVKKSIIKQICLALCIALLPLSVFATGLGKLTVFSALGEPLNAEIELLSVSPEELASLSVALASQDQYALQGIDKTAIQHNIKAQLSKKTNGVNVIQLTSTQVVTDPFLDMLIQVVWSDGQLSREYTLLLDPPEYSVANLAPPVVESSKPIVDLAKNSTPSSSVANPAIDEKTSSNLINKIVDRDSYKKSYVFSPKTQSITTVKGDSLSGIAKSVQVEDVNLDQMLMALYAANPSAFEGENMNRLKVGQVIHVPSQEILKGISKDEARREVHAQVSNWHAYTAKIAEEVSQSKPSDELANRQSSGKIVTQAEDKATPVTEGTHDVIKLAKTQSPKQVESSQAEANKNEKLTKNNLNDDLAANNNAIKETDERSAALEKQIADMNKLIAIKNKSMSEAQKNAEKTKKNAVEAPSILEVVDPIILTTVASVLGFMLILWLWLIRKHKKQLESSLKVDTPVNSDSFADFMAEIGGPASSFQPDFSTESGSIVDTHEVDPIAEADVFLAYGRQTQAEEILKDAIQKHPERYEVHLKLLTIYAENKNTSAFELLAVELFSQLGSNDPVWVNVSELGLTIDPDNKLYHRAKDSGALVLDSLDKLGISDFSDAVLMDDIHDSNAELGGHSLNSADSLNDTLDFESEMIDFNKDFISADSPNSSMLSAEITLPVLNESGSDLEEISFDVPEYSDTQDLPPLKENAVDLAEISLNFEPVQLEPIQLDPIDVAVATIPDAFSGDFSNLLKVDLKSDPRLTLVAPSQPKIKLSEDNTIKSDFPESDEVLTKLELAAAYIDMDDKEGALELLAEALKEGGPKQRERAQALIDSLA